MSRHAGPGPAAGPPPPPEPSYAERARTLVHLARAGTLATLSRRHPGHPFGSVMPYAPDARGAPLLLISSMAMHTQNLEADQRTSLLVTQPGWTEEPLAGGRVTLMGRAARVPDGERPAAREAYLARHPNAAFWVDFEDFAFWRLEVADVYFVGGFAAMDWVTGAGYAAARPDPLVDVAEGIVEHMNRDHADALLVLARAHADADAEEATMLSVDRLGFRVRVRRGERLHGARLAFPREVVTPEQCRAVLIEMIRAARR
jgi:heme oxygenase (biliverdin-IX-beta and delta-forming)